MNPLPYELFLIATKEKSFSEAAKKAFISQQAFSYHIANLEKQYGVLLFERTTPLKLTYAGKRMEELARTLLQMDQQIRQEMADIDSGEFGEISVGIGRDRSYLLSDVLPLFYSLYPNYVIHCTESYHSKLSQQLLDGNINILISSSTQNLPDIISTELMTDYLVFTAHDTLLKKYSETYYDTILSGEEKPLSFQYFEKCPIVLPNPHSKTRQAAENFFKTHNYHPRVIATMDSGNIQTSIVTNGFGGQICFNAPLQNRLNRMPEELRRQMHVFRIQDLSKETTVSLSRLAGRYLSHAEKQFISLFLDSCQVTAKK